MNTKKSIHKSCVVPECSNTSVSTPNKLFISLPSNVKLRRAWQRAMRRSVFVSDIGSRYCCEDHFDVEEDIENYRFIKTMGTGKIRLRSGVIPHKFDCQKEPKLKQSLKTTGASAVASESKEGAQSDITTSKTCDTGTQVCLKPQKRSKAIQTSL